MKTFQNCFVKLNYALNVMAKILLDSLVFHERRGGFKGGLEGFIFMGIFG